jgi:hypothetical protein
MIRLQAFQTAAREVGFVKVSESVEKKHGRRKHANSPAYVHRQPDKQRDSLLDDRSGESKFEDISRRSSTAGMVQVKSESDRAAMRCTVTSPILPLKILLIENDPAVAGEIRLTLKVAGTGSFDLEWVRQLSEGLQLLKREKIAAVLLELSLPDSLGHRDVRFFAAESQSGNFGAFVSCGALAHQRVRATIFSAEKTGNQKSRKKEFLN